MLIFILAPFGEAISEVNLASFRRARTILSEPTMSEVIDEDAQAHEAFHDCIRHEIVNHCEHLRVHYTLIERLMGIYSLSVATFNAKNKGKGKATTN